jgi:HD-GYP domain-containing protein (c-di-GMP phosphodiesterase class II)
MDIAKLLDRLAEDARRVVGMEQSAVLLGDHLQPETYMVVAAQGAGQDLIGRRFPRGHGLGGLVMRSGRPLVLPEYDRIGRPIDDPAAIGVYAAASAPIAWDGAVRGALSVATRERGRRLSVEEFELLAELAELAAVALDHHEQRADLSPTTDAQVSALLTALELCDPRTMEHSEETARIARLAGERLGLRSEELWEMGLAARLHDVGKVRVPPEILGKPAVLSGEERQIVEQHPVWGAQLVAAIPGLQAVAVLVRHHHERIDGTGYPSGLRADRIPPAARIIAACDAYGAMTEDRPYRAAMSEADALAELRRGAGTQFDPAVVDALSSVVLGGTEARPREPALA